MTVFEIDARQLNFDTTSVNVFGDYDLVDPPFDITYGYSKDHRPDLKQFIVSVDCHNIFPKQSHNILSTAN
jgi:transposase